MCCCASFFSISESDEDEDSKTKRKRAKKEAKRDAKSNAKAQEAVGAEVRVCSLPARCLFNSTTMVRKYTRHELSSIVTCLYKYIACSGLYTLLHEQGGVEGGGEKEDLFVTCCLRCDAGCCTHLLAPLRGIKSSMQPRQIQSLLVVAGELS